jgi:uncharacterized protein YggT (Ycf19 family)
VIPLLALVVNLAFNTVELVIVAGVFLSLITQVTRARWTRHVAVRALILSARALCAPARQLIKALRIPTAPLDLSPLVTLIGLRVVQVVVWVLRLLP